MSLRNLPTDEPEQLASLVKVKPGQVSSMGLTPVDNEATLMLFSYAEGESVAEEIYPKDILYYLVEGSVDISLPGRSVSMTSGDVFMVKAGVEHAMNPTSACKILQLMA